MPNERDNISILNINPEITFFKSVFKRHTDFTIDEYQQNENVTFGSEIEIKIENSGDLLSDIYIEFILPKVSGHIITGDHTYAHWVNGVGFALLNEVTLSIDNTIIDKHTGLWYDIWNELTDVNKKQWSMVGKYDIPKINYKEINETKYYVPLIFYFNKNKGLSLPLFLINDPKIKLEIKFNKLRNLLHFDSGTFNEYNTISKFKVNTTKVKLTNSEKELMKKQNEIQYLIETVSIKNNLSKNDLVNNLYLSDSVKEIIWVFRHKDRIANASDLTTNKINLPGSTSNNTYPNDIFNYSKINKNGLEIETLSNNVPSLQNLNTTIKLASDSSSTDDFYNNYYITITSGTGASQSRYITDYNGTNKVATVNTAWNIKPDDTSVYKINVLAQSGSTSTITLTSGSSSTDNYYNNHYITIIEGTGINQSRTITDYNGTTKVAIVDKNWTIQPDNTSIYKINKIYTFDNFTNLKLQIDQEDILTVRDASYYRIYGPYKHHSKIPGGIEQNEKSKYIYMYSFSLNPEEFQPSGHYNFDSSNSKINFKFDETDSIIDLENYDLTIFSLKYKYLKIVNGIINLTSVQSIGTFYDSFYQP
jgi:hypothetical protein